MPIVLEPVDQLEVYVLVDNATDSLSSVPAFVETEFAGLGRRRHGNWVLGGRSLCCAAHGLSCLITTRADRKRAILFDTGPEDRTFEQNVSRLDADLGSVEAIVLSHGHWDHGGAALRALDLIRNGNGGNEVPYYAHPDMFRTRAVKVPSGAMVPMEDVPRVDELTAHGARVVNTKEAQSIFGGSMFVSGEIPRVTSFERGFPEQYRRTVDGRGWEHDPLTIDERFVAVHVADKGLVVFTACSHAGVVNVLKHAAESFPGVPLYGVFGGLHLAGANEQIIPPTIDELREFELRVIATGHCTGWRATAALRSAFGDERLAPLAVGKRYAL
jgi:7,8-dihydropterin-6-yl-methyl-4-(beta-D-ribofuranosyl)aminobenzene 5'-phosphate synthase